MSVTPAAGQPSRQPQAWLTYNVRRNMKPFVALVVVLLAVVKVACLGAPPQPEPKDVLVGPYELRLSVEPKRCHPHDDVTLTIEFKNTGTTFLLVPMRQDLQVEFKDSGAEDFVLLPPSECSGTQYARIEPGKSLTYLRGVKVPNMHGVVEIHVLSKSIPLEITEANQALVPTPASVTPAAGAPVAPDAGAAHL